MKGLGSHFPHTILCCFCLSFFNRSTENCAAQSYTATASCAASSPVRREVTGTKPAAASLDDSFDLDDELTQEIFEVLSQFDAPSLPPTALASAGRAAMSKATQPVASAAGASSYCASPLSRNTTPLRPQPQTQRRTPEYRRQQTYTVAASPLLPANRATTLTLPQPAPTTTTHANPQPQPAQPPQQPPPQEAVSPAPQRCASGGSSTVTDSQGSDAGGGSQGDGGIRRKYTASEIEQKRKLARAKSNRRRAQMLLQQRRAASAGGNVPPAAQSAPAAMHRAASTAGLTDSQRAALVSAGAIPNAAALMATSHQHHCPAAKRFAPEKVG